MAYEQPFEDTQALFTQAILNADLTSRANISILVDNRQKTISKVSKCSPTEKFKTADDFNIFLNEKIFEQLTDEQKVLTVEETVACLTYDGEKDIVEKKDPDFKSFSGLLHRHTFPVINVLHESIRTLYATEKQLEDEAKAAKTAKSKPNFKKG